MTATTILGSVDTSLTLVSHVRKSKMLTLKKKFTMAAMFVVYVSILDTVSSATTMRTETDTVVAIALETLPAYAN